MICKRCAGTGKEADIHTLLRLRAKSGKTQQDVAQGMGITPQYLSDLEHGRRDWDTELLEKFKKAIAE